MVQQIQKPNQNNINGKIKEGENLSSDYDDRPIWEIVVEIGKQIPDEELAKIPTDLARNFERYSTLGNHDQ